jgi:hypothetical protein
MGTEQSRCEHTDRRQLRRYLVRSDLLPNPRLSTPLSFHPVPQLSGTQVWNTTSITRDDSSLLSPVLINDLSMLLVH